MFGIGLRSEHYPFLEQRPKTRMDWFEAISENYMDSQGRPLKMLSLMREDYPIALHGVGLSIASAEAVNPLYLQQLRNLIARIDPFIVSDHLCWTGSLQHNLHDLLPFPLTEESLNLVTSKIHHVQEQLKRVITLENVSTYLSSKQSTHTEGEFLGILAKRTGCQILLDVNNLYINSQNHHFDPMTFLDQIPLESIGQIHLAGHIIADGYLFDTHSTPVCDDVWKLFAKLVPLLPKDLPIMVEWDGDIPEFERVEEEVLRAKKIWELPHAPARMAKPIHPSHHPSGYH